MTWYIAALTGGGGVRILALEDVALVPQAYKAALRVSTQTQLLYGTREDLDKAIFDNVGGLYQGRDIQILTWDGPEPAPDQWNAKD